MLEQCMADADDMLAVRRIKKARSLLTGMLKCLRPEDRHEVTVDENGIATLHTPSGAQHRINFGG